MKQIITVIFVLFINTISCGQTTTSLIPDITVQDVDAPTFVEFPSTNNVTTISCTVYKTGTVTATTLGYYISTDNIFDASDVVLKTIDIDFSNSSSVVASNPVSIPIGVGNSPGAYYFLCVVDPDNAINESSESNNTAFKIVGIGTQLSNLVVSGLTINKDNNEVGSGENVIITTTISNESPGCSEATVLRYYLTDDIPWNDNDFFLKEEIISPFSCQSSISLSKIYTSYITIPTGIQNFGSYNIVAKITPVDNESDETDNSKSIGVSVLDIAYPDVLATNLQTPSEIRIGKPFPISCQIKNDSNVPVSPLSAELNIKYFLSPTIEYNTATAITLENGNAWFSKIPENTTSDVINSTPTIPNDTPLGEYYILCYVNPAFDGTAHGSGAADLRPSDWFNLNRLNESNYGNNVLATSLIKVDKEVLAITNLATLRSPIGLGEDITINCNIENSGGMISDPTDYTLEYYISASGNFDDATYLGVKNVPSINVGASIPMVFKANDKTILNDFREGQHAIFSVLKSDFSSDIIQSITVSLVPITHVPDDQVTMLKHLYETTNGQNWTPYQWDFSRPPSDLYLAEFFPGLTIDLEGNLTAINLPNNNLKGVLPNNITVFSELTTIDVSNNHLTALPRKYPASLASLLVNENHLSFGSFSSIAASVNSTPLFPSKKIKFKNITVDESSPIAKTVTLDTELALELENPHPDNQYEWIFTDIDEVKYSVGVGTVLNPDQAGTYYCTITNKLTDYLGESVQSYTIEVNGSNTDYIPPFNPNFLEGVRETPIPYLNGSAIQLESGAAFPVFPTGFCTGGKYKIGLYLEIEKEGVIETPWDFKITVSITKENGEVMSPRTLKIDNFFEDLQASQDLQNQTILSATFLDATLQCSVDKYKINIISAAIGGEGTLTSAQLLKIQDEISLIVKYFPVNRNILVEDPDANFGFDVASSNGEVNLSWQEWTGATHFDVEWVYIDEYSQYESYDTFKSKFPDGEAPLPEEYPFSLKEPIRVTTKYAEKFYTPHISYPEGKVYFRIRGSSNHPQKTSQKIYGNWQYPTVGYLEISDLASSEKVSHEQTINWQYVTTYAEEGKYKKVMSYYDGGMRNRQTQTNLNTNSLALVAETFYDYEGRGTVNVLPVPINNNTSLNYKPSFNAFVGTALLKSRYDNLSGNIDNLNQLSSNTGAAFYYNDTNNPLPNAGLKGYIPKGNGYEYTQVGYLRDNTGRVSVQSGVGETFNIKSSETADYFGKVTRYFYGNAKKEELNRLFGETNIGNISHYKKNMVLDPNKQASISYLDQEGRVIATALAGDASENLLPLNYEDYGNVNLTDITIDLSDKNIADIGTRTRTTSETLMKATAATTRYTFTYNFDIDPKAYNIIYYSSQTATTPVSNTLNIYPEYELEISLYDPYGRRVDMDSGTDDAIADGIYRKRFKLPVKIAPYEHEVLLTEVGNYKLVKKLRLIDAKEQIRAALKAHVNINVNCFPSDTDFDTEYVSGDEEEEDVKDEPENAVLPTNVCDGFIEAIKSDIMESCMVETFNLIDPATEEEEGNNQNEDTENEDLQITVDEFYEAVSQNDFTLIADRIYNQDNGIEGATALENYEGCPKLNDNGDHESDNGQLLYFGFKEIKKYYEEQYLVCLLKQENNLYLDKIAKLRDNDFIKDKILLDISNKKFGENNQDNWKYFWPMLIPEEVLDGNGNPVSITSINALIQYGDELNNQTGWNENAAHIDHAFLEADRLYSYNESDMFAAIREELSKIAYTDVDGDGHHNAPIYDALGREFNINDEPNFYNRALIYHEDKDENGEDVPLTEQEIIDRPWKIFFAYYTTAKMRIIMRLEAKMKGLESSGEAGNAVLEDYKENEGYNNFIDNKGSELARLEGYFKKTPTKKPGQYIPRPDIDADIKSVYNAIEDHCDIALNSNDTTAIRGFIKPYFEDNVFFAQSIIHYEFDANGEVVADDEILSIIKYINKKYTCDLTNSPDCAYLPEDGEEVSEFCIEQYNFMCEGIATGKGFVPVEPNVSAKRINSVSNAIDLNLGFDEFNPCNESSSLDLRGVSIDFVFKVEKGGGGQGLIFQHGNQGVTVDEDGHLRVGTYTTPYSIFGECTTVSIDVSRYHYGCSIADGCQPDCDQNDAGYSQTATQISNIYININGGRISGSHWKDLLQNDTAFIGEVGVSFSDFSIESYSKVHYDDDVNSITILNLAGLSTIDWTGDAPTSELISCDYEEKEYTYCTGYAAPAVVYDYVCDQEALSLAATRAELNRLTNLYYQSFIKHSVTGCKDKVMTQGNRPSDWDNIKDEYGSLDSTKFLYEYSDKEYHYTLYYYDQAGNLVQTVPPAGVDITDQNHGLKTNYKYNSLNQLVWQRTPDGGVSTFHYDDKGQLKLSQNASQAAESVLDTNFNHYSYTKYDAQGRIIEVGALKLDNDINFNDKINDLTFPTQETNVQELSEITRTFYDIRPDDESIGIEVPNDFEPQNLRGRVSCVQVQDKNQENGTVTFYSYDQHGNVSSLLQQLPDLNENENTKTTAYDYDLVSGNVNYVIYQKGKDDQFYHHYEYDADNRLLTVETSLDGFVWNQEATYEYYAHGPLARIELGEYKVQQLEYYYTLQGWIKGVNLKERDDAINTSSNAFSYALGYFDGDYEPITGNVDDPLNINNWAETTGFGNNTTSLYNGNIAWMTTNLAALANPMQGMAYRYDQLNRIRKSHSYHKNAQGGWNRNNLTTEGDDYDTNYQYDPNGNLTTLQRYATNGIFLDNLTYNYTTGTNQLGNVGNAAQGILDLKTYDGSSNNPLPGASGPSKNYNNIIVKNHNLSDTEVSFLRAIESVRLLPNFHAEEGSSLHIKPLNPDDLPKGLETQADGNYGYDAIGNLVYDLSEKIEIEWTIYGKVANVKKYETATIISGVATFTKHIATTAYRYDGAGNRVEKIVETGLNAVAPQVYKKTTTFYIRDASGNIMANYSTTVDTIDATSPAAILKEQAIYGSSRLGVYIGKGQWNKNTLGNRTYELSNHLGNVLSVITDNKIIDTEDVSAITYNPKIIKASDYYPFGLEMKGRSFKDASYDSYRFGFNGKENDTDFGNKQLVQDYGFRIYNPAIAKFLSVDPLAQEYPYYTPYQFAGNKPIAAIDLDGLESRIVIYNQDSEGKLRTIIFDGKTLYKSVQISGKYAMHSKISKAEWKSLKNGYLRAFMSSGNPSSTGSKPYGNGAIEGKGTLTGFAFTGQEISYSFNFDDNGAEPHEFSMSEAYGLYRNTYRGKMFEETVINYSMMVTLPFGGEAFALTRTYLQSIMRGAALRAAHETVAQGIAGGFDYHKMDIADIFGAVVLKGVYKDIFNSAVDLKNGQLKLKDLDKTAEDLIIKIGLNFGSGAIGADKLKFVKKVIVDTIKKVAKEDIKDAVFKE